LNALPRLQALPTIPASAAFLQFIYNCMKRWLTRRRAMRSVAHDFVSPPVSAREQASHFHGAPGEQPL
jgi:hypothetical protein